MLYHTMTLQKQTSLIHRGTIDILTGGFPCQPYSQQGNEKEKKMTATSGRKCLEQLEKFSRVGLWAKTFSALLNWSGGLVFDEVQADLEAEGYEVFPYSTSSLRSTLPTEGTEFGLLPTVSAMEHEHIQRQIGQNFQLNPLFVLEMMGYPPDWTLIPFQKQSGEQRA
jgi:hypothetical protein